MQVDQWKRLNQATRDLSFWEKFWLIRERLQPLFEPESSYEEWKVGQYYYQGMMHTRSRKQNGIVRCWEPNGEISVYTSKHGKLHGLCICLGPGELRSCRVSLFNHGNLEDNFYLDTNTGVVRTGVEGGNGVLTTALPVQHLLREDVSASMVNFYDKAGRKSTVGSNGRPSITRFSDRLHPYVNN